MPPPCVADVSPAHSEGILPLYNDHELYNTQVNCNTYIVSCGLALYEPQAGCLRDARDTVETANLLLGLEFLFQIGNDPNHFVRSLFDGHLLSLGFAAKLDLDFTFCE